MLKTISAALLAVSVLAAPALAAGPAKTTNAPVTKAEATQVKQVKQVKPNLLNAKAKMAHRQHARHHRAHKHMSALKTHQSSKVSIKHAGPATKRG